MEKCGIAYMSPSEITESPKTLYLKESCKKPTATEKEEPSFLQKLKSYVCSFFISPERPFEKFLVDHKPKKGIQAHSFSQINALPLDMLISLSMFLDKQSLLALLQTNTDLTWKFCAKRQNNSKVDRSIFFSIFVRKMLEDLSRKSMTSAHSKQLDRFRDHFGSADPICLHVERLNLVELMCTPKGSFEVFSNSAMVFRYIPRFPNVQRLELSKHVDNKDPLMDMALKYISTLSQLVHLGLNDQNVITDESLKEISKVSSLKVLHLRKCERLTDKGMLYLEQLSQLKYLDLLGCKQITDTAKAHLREKGLLVRDETHDVMLSAELIQEASRSVLTA